MSAFYLVFEGMESISICQAPLLMSKDSILGTRRLLIAFKIPKIGDASINIPPAKALPASLPEPSPDNKIIPPMTRGIPAPMIKPSAALFSIETTYSILLILFISITP